MENDLKNILENISKNGVPDEFVERLKELRASTYLDKQLRITGHQLASIIGSITAMIIGEREGREMTQKDVSEIGTEVFKLLPQIFKQLEKS